MGTKNAFHASIHPKHNASPQSWIHGCIDFPIAGATDDDGTSRQSVFRGWPEFGFSCSPPMVSLDLSFPDVSDGSDCCLKSLESKFFDEEPSDRSSNPPASVQASESHPTPGPVWMDDGSEPKALFLKSSTAPLDSSAGQDCVNFLITGRPTGGKTPFP